MGISFLGGLTLLTVINASAWAVQRDAGSHAARARGDQWAEFRWWELFGGIIGSCTLTASVGLSPFLGYTAGATLTAAGQVLSSMCCDHYGFLGMPRRRLSLRKLGGAVLVVAGCVGSSVSVATGSAAGAAAALSPAATALCALVYFGIRGCQPVQTCINRRLSERLPLRSMAAVVSFIAGTLALCSYCTVLFTLKPGRSPCGTCARAQNIATALRLAQHACDVQEL